MQLEVCLVSFKVRGSVRGLILDGVKLGGGIWWKCLKLVGLGRLGDPHPKTEIHHQTFWPRRVGYSSHV